MTHKQLFDLLNTIEIPVAYSHFDSNKNLIPPFMVYRETSPDTFKAENKTYYKHLNFEIELVTEKKNVLLESQIEALLDSNNIPYDKLDEVWDNDEKIYHNFYEL